jgi:hypothetical protein
MTCMASHPIPLPGDLRYRVHATALGAMWCFAALLMLCTSAHAQSCVTPGHQGGIAPPERKLYLIIGQSNAAGLASVKDLVPPAKDYVSLDTHYPNVQIYGIRGADPGVAGNDDAIRSLSVEWSQFAGWHTVKPGFGFKNLSGNESYFPSGVTALDLFGPEIYLSHHLNEDSPREHYVLKLAISNTTLAQVPNADSWMPGGHLYKELLRMVVDAHRKKSREASLKVAAIFFVQGESDAMDLNRADAYEKNIVQFIKKIRSDLLKIECVDFMNVPFIMSRVQSNPAWPFGNIVRRAQEKASRTLIRVKLIDTDDFREHVTAGNSHFNEYGQAKLGERFYRSLNPVMNRQVKSSRSRFTP